MKKAFFIFLFSLFFSSLVSGIAFAQNFGSEKAAHLSGAKSFGLSIVSFNGIEPDLASLNFRFWFDDNVGVEGYLAASDGDVKSVFYLEGKLLAIIKNYVSLNLYASAFAGGGGIGISKYDSLLNIGAGLGIEWFLTNNLSISNEINLLYSEKSGNGSQFGISADVLPKAGIRIYF